MDLVIYGAGGFGKEIACLIRAINKDSNHWNLIGFIDDGIQPGEKNRYGTVLGGLSFLNEYSQKLAVVFSIASPSILQSLVSSITNPLVTFPNIIAPNVNIFDAESFSLGKGNVFFFGCRISCDVQIGDFNLFNGFVSLGHDVTMGSYNVLGPSTRVSGNTIIGDSNLFGVQSIVLQGLKIGDHTRIGPNSVIIRDTKNNSLYYGNPAKRVKM
ncbi:MAG: acetyltransferase [Chlorobiaceae bacterium]|nr:acetyltransferase [Chlorobiaceae bacterium]